MASILHVLVLFSSILRYLHFVEGQISSVISVSSGGELKMQSAVSRSIDAVPISLQGYKLNGFHYKVVYSGTLIGCGQACLTDFPKCVSYNYYTKSMGQEICELNSKGINSVAEGISGSLQKDSSSVYVQTQSSSMKYPKTCADHYKVGSRESGLYYLRDDSNHYFQVFCDFTSEPRKVWTLIMSWSKTNIALVQFQRSPFFKNDPLREDNPNWDKYRLSLPRMQLISNGSTHWRITCNFPQDGLTNAVNPKDYVRGKIAEFDILKLDGNEQCKKAEYINVLGHNCTSCTSAWWQGNTQILHHDITANACDFGPTPGGSSSQDVFGFYHSVNNKFTCSSSAQSNTNTWFGSKI